MTPAQIVTLSKPGDSWDPFVRARPGASIYLRGGWGMLLHEVFGHEAYFI
jgi:hypothetical protein